ncbi:hypothetical protein ACX0G7_25975 [Flavitalea antarctica]
MENLQFLRNREILDEEQYEALKDELLAAGTMWIELTSYARLRKYFQVCGKL